MTRFAIGQRVRSRVDAQRMAKGQELKVVDVQVRSMFMGGFTTVVAQDVAGFRYQVTNPHLVLDIIEDAAPAVKALHEQRDAAALSQAFAAGGLSEADQVWLFGQGWRTRGSALVYFPACTCGLKAGPVHASYCDVWKAVQS